MELESRLPLIFIVGDFGAGDLAFAEIKRKIKNRIRDADIDYVTVPSYSTIATGFCIYQLSLDGEIWEDSEKGIYIFSNTAPRRDDPNPRRENEGEHVVYVKLNNGLELFATLSGYTLSFVKPLIEDLRVVKVDNRGSQFRSRDRYPEPLSKIIHKDYSVLGDKLDIRSIPDPPRDRIAYVDGYGNIKLTTRVSDVDFRHGERIRVDAGKKSLYGVYTEGMFSIKEGDLSVSPGSSGPIEDRFLQVSIRLGNAWERLGRPPVETKLSLRRIKGIG